VLETLAHFLDTATTTYVQNWLHVWKPFILSSVKSTNDLALQGVCAMATYFTPTQELRHRPLADRSHRAQLVQDNGIMPLFLNHPSSFDPCVPSIPSQPIPPT
jgi:hypothetical protein